jgi:hypothetical protein
MGKGAQAMRQQWSRILLCVAACAGAAASQIITFNGPMPWVTQRNDSITVRAQIDTAQIKNKDFSLSVDLINDRGQKKSLVTKSFPIKDYTVEFPVGSLKENLVGGRSFIKIDWSITGTTNKGSISPLGIVALDKLPPAEEYPIVHAAEGADPAAVASSLSDADFKAAGSDKFGLAWNKSALYVILLKNEHAAPGTIRFAVDGKNGKNAFLSFSDRVVVYNGEKDSLFGLHYSQQLTGDTIKYSEKPWPNELTKTASNDRVVIRVPWYDIGIVPFDGRKFGLGIVTFDASGIQQDALPKKAEFYNPGTWSTFQLAK